MIQDISITLLPEQEKDTKLISTLLFEALHAKGIEAAQEDTKFVFQKKSVDARHGKVKFNLKYKAYMNEEIQEEKVPEWKNASGSKTVIIIGAGPAGLFGALRLLEDGIRPVIIERGDETSPRKKDIAAISTKGIVDPDSNYCFGEGGAGTFSDGKLYTRSNKRGNIAQVLKIFEHFGADPKITTDAHPHIGTDRLPAIINNMREKIKSLGGEVHFNTRCTEFITENAGGRISVKGVVCRDARTNEEQKFLGDAVLLATGHSANDIYELVGRTNPSSLEAKTFAVGVRVEHPRQIIDKIQYKKNASDPNKNLGAAEYNFTTQQDGRGVYSFCMCPGGFVVPSASDREQIVVNGMSAAKRNSPWSNAAVVVETRPEDIPSKFIEEAKEKKVPALAGLYWRTWLEKETFCNGDGQKAPCQLITDFVNHRDTKADSLPKSSYAPGLVPSRLDRWLPAGISKRLEASFREVDSRLMRGYITSQALLIATETRTSTPVRIRRNRETGVCEGLENLYPAGEGSGYSGGIVSSAMDGINMCRLISCRLKK